MSRNKAKENKEAKEEKIDWTCYSPFMDLRGKRNGLPHNEGNIGEEAAAKEGEQASNAKKFISLYCKETATSFFMHEIDQIMQCMDILLPTAELESLYGKYNSIAMENWFKITYSYNAFQHSFRIIFTFEPESRDHRFSESIYLEFDVLDHGETVDRKIRLVDNDDAHSPISFPATLVNLLCSALAKDQSNANGSKQSNEVKQ